MATTVHAGARPASPSRRLMPAGFALVVAVSWNVGNVGSVTDALASAYGVSVAAIGVLTTVLFLSQMVTQVPAGRWLDRAGPRRAAGAALGFTVAGNAISLIGPSLAVAATGRAVTGVGLGLGFITGSRLVQLHGGTALASGVYGGLALGAGGLSLALLPGLEGQLGWRAPFLSALVAAVALAPLILAVVPRAWRAQQAAPLMRVLADRQVWVLSVLHASTFGFGIVISGWLAPLLLRAGYDATTAGLVAGSTLLLGVLSRPGGGWLVRSRPAARGALLRASALGGAVGTALLTVTGVPAAIVLGAVLVGLAAGAPFGPVVAHAARLHAGSAGATMAAVNTVAVLVVVVWTPLVGLGFGLPGDGRAGFLAIALLWGASTLAVSRLRPIEVAAPHRGFP